MKVKIRQLPDGINYINKTSDYLVIAQSTGGQVTRKITLAQLATKLYISGAYCSINTAGRIDVNATGINALLDPRFNSIEARLNALESKVASVENTIETNTSTTSPTTIYFDGTHTSSGGANTSTASTAVVNVAKSVFSNHAPNSTVIIRWYRYWSWGTGNGSASKTQYFISEYRVVSGTTWTLIKDTHLSG